MTRIERFGWRRQVDLAQCAHGRVNAQVPQMNWITVFTYVPFAVFALALAGVGAVGLGAQCFQ